MSRGAPLAIVVIAALTLSACESSQTRSARLRAAAATRPVERGLAITRTNPDVRVESTTIVNDDKIGRSAAVVELHNTSKRPLAALPLLFTVAGAGGKKLFSNGLPGASPDLTTVPSLGPGDTLSWVNDAIVNVKGGRAVDARVGEPATAPATGSAAPPQLRLSAVRLETDPVDGVTATGRVFNPSQIPQERLVIFATARRGAKIVAAGRAVVPLVKPGSAGARFTIFFVGDPTGAKLRIQAPAVTMKTKP
jgi:hypothetical protein